VAVACHQLGRKIACITISLNIIKIIVATSIFTFTITLTFIINTKVMSRSAAGQIRRNILVRVFRIIFYDTSCTI